MRLILAMVGYKLKDWLSSFPAFWLSSALTIDAGTVSFLSAQSIRSMTYNVSRRVVPAHPHLTFIGTDRHATTYFLRSARHKLSIMTTAPPSPTLIFLVVVVAHLAPPIIDHRVS